VAELKLASLSHSKKVYSFIVTEYGQTFVQPQNEWNFGKIDLRRFKNGHCNANRRGTQTD